ncbi:N-acetylmuramoyl-L-alanine amidase family protein [Pelagicoccus mobilis]|uniref:N-acetylmuramoyl-L-alanine amidase n=1 Tax=Pelagicoccus mobilis TaxID=415221 RepID=A0A934S623_9BACT|nr:N-acetylmuramoyl-L-alanine amidase [Pelagicoccus mobilis]MBK1880422.1 N-acetylmuramoyl-L-alanine amidase [Pelagicoccus mobilis]
MEICILNWDSGKCGNGRLRILVGGGGVLEMRWWLLLGFLFVWGCSETERVDQVLSPAAKWEVLDLYQGSVHRAAFEKAMDEVYASKANWREWMDVEEEGVTIAKGAGSEPYFLRFAMDAPASKRKHRSSFEGMRIAIDPGHLGGKWGRMEHRSFAIGEGAIVQEGDLVLATALRLERELEALGAEVFLLRESAGPVTRLRPKDFQETALGRYPGGASEELEERRTGLANLLFYRSAEIRARADRLKEQGGADLAIVLHINASSAPNEAAPTLLEKNDAHILVNGCYLSGELARESQRSELLLRLVKGYHHEELRWGEAMAEAMLEGTGLPAYSYVGDNASSRGGKGYLWARNLMAGRIYDCPVLFLEPWRANSVSVYEWAGAGDYAGERMFNGEMRESLPAVYCAFVVEGLKRGLAAGQMTNM